jgi:hypothetical protein
MYDVSLNPRIRVAVILFFAAALFACLPASAQNRTVGFLGAAPGVFDGYTLLMPSGAKNTYLIDNCGRAVHSWQSTNLPGSVARIISGGRLLRAEKVTDVFTGGGAGGRVAIYNWDGSLQWGYNYCDSNICQHHDVYSMPNGHVLLIAWEKHTLREAIPLGRDTVNFAAKTLLAERIVELEPVDSVKATVVWQWSTWDHMVQQLDSTRSNYGPVSVHPELLDINADVHAFGELYHFNSVAYNPELDQIMVCSPLMNEIYVVDHSTTTAQAATHTGGRFGQGGDIIYRWGNPQMYGRGTSADRIFYGQHDAHWIANGRRDAGKVIVFNNGNGRPDSSYSEIDVFEPTFFSTEGYPISNDSAFGPDAVTRSYRATPATSMYDGNTCSADMLPNGNILVCVSNSGKILEVDSAGSLVWTYVSPVTGQGMTAQGAKPQGNPIFRAYKYAANSPELAGWDLTPGEHLELNPMLSACDSVSAVEETPTTAGLSIFGNPFDDLLTFAIGEQTPVRVEVVDIAGRLMTSVSVRNHVTIETATWARGVYVVHLIGASPAGHSVRLIVKQ